MFALALLIGIYSYLILDLGLLGLLFSRYIFISSLVFLLFSLFIFRQKIKFIRIPYFKKFISGLPKLDLILLSIIIAMSLVNLIGVFGPEISFDALWYHLTLPKIYLQNHNIFYIPGNLLYYSTIPKLTEILYIPGILLAGETLPKLIHFTFGILCIGVIYQLARRYLSQTYSLLAVLIFYSNLVVAWESVASYVDLSRTFFEVLAFLAFLIWFKNKKYEYLVLAAIILGLAVSAKLVALFSLVVFGALIVYLRFKGEIKCPIALRSLIVFLVFSLLIPLPWFIFAYLNTGNPIYPFLSISFDSQSLLRLPNVLNLFNDLKVFFLYLSDPINPMYLILLIPAIILFKNLKTEEKLLGIYCLISFLIWYLFQQANGGRFILPYLPVFSVFSALIISKLNQKNLRNFLIVLVVFVSLTTLFYRGMANKKYLPVILGQQSKASFLAQNLNFSFGDFYDTDQYLGMKIKPSDRALLIGFHNLYYVDFPYLDSSWAKKDDKFNYVVTQNTELPERFKDLNYVYYNPLTHVKLYDLGGKWISY